MLLFEFRQVDIFDFDVLKFIEMSRNTDVAHNNN